MPPLSTFASNRDNNFNLIRFVAASLVLYSHSFPLALGIGNHDPVRAVIGTTLANIAVDVFFITSGFLITNSFLKHDLRSFVWARVLRIYPALIISTLLCILLGVLVTNLSFQEYFFRGQLLRYLFYNSTLFFGVEFYLPGVFLDVPSKPTVNGSLWTLPYEVWMYTLLVISLTFLSRLKSYGWFSPVNHGIALLAVTALLLHLVSFYFDLLPFNAIRLFHMFFIGSAFYVLRDKIHLSQTWIAFCALLLIAPIAGKDSFYLVYCLALPFVVFYLAYGVSGRILAFNKLGDYSYGIYIYAYPVQQSIVYAFNGISVANLIIVSFPVTLALAMLSWHLVESRMPNLKRKLLDF
jgi:peptidoglycan/LPS O-acetylase OafA/YrhL